MADEFQGGVCGGSWWPTNSSANLFRSSPCSSAINGPGSFGWLNNEPIVDNTKTARSVSDDSAGTASDGSGSIVLQDAQKPSDDQNASIASTLQMMGINLSSSSTTTSDDSWNQNLLHDNGRSEQQNYPNHMLQPNPGFINNNPSMNYDQNSSFNSNFRQDNQSYPFNISASYGYTSPFLFDTNSQPGQQSLLDNNQSSTIYSSCANYMDSSEYIRLPLQKQQPSNNPLQFTNNTPFWNATAADFLPSSRPQLVVASSATGAKPNLHSLSTKQRNQESAGQGLNSAATTKKASNEPSFKRPRIETPSPLPTFKVRKEKLGDRITALQQLVSPFGKTDTASVLHEAIEYIKFLHDQVGVLSTPYLKNGPPHQLQHQQAGEKMKDENGQIQDLKSRGLCLVPISTTFPVTAESTTDLWTPTFGGCFR